jgi:ketosteroid isomerase-like protein
MAVIHDQVVSFGPNSRLPTVGKEAFRREAQARFAKTESLSVTRIDPQFRVIGNMGVAWGLYTTTVKPKDGSSVTSSGRYTLTYTKVDGKWLLIAGHVS